LNHFCTTEKRSLIFGTKTKNLSDEQLLSNYRSDGKSCWVGELYARYNHLVFGLCLKYLKNKDDARDATLSLFEKLLRDLRSHEVQQFQHWIYMVSKNHCLMILRARTSQHEKMNEYKRNGAHSETAEEMSYAEMKERGLTHLEEAINRLNSHQEKCVRLFYLEEKSYREIAEQTTYTINDVKSYIQNGRRNLKLLLTG